MRNRKVAVAILLVLRGGKPFKKEAPATTNEHFNITTIETAAGCQELPSSLPFFFVDASTVSGLEPDTWYPEAFVVGFVQRVSDN